MQNCNTENECDDNKVVKRSSEKMNLKGDYGNIAILLMLYVLQGDRNVQLLTNQLIIDHFCNASQASH